MSQQYVDAAVQRLQGSEWLTSWATGGILNRDPRRSGPDATEQVFERDGTGEIKPTIAITYGAKTRVVRGPASMFDVTVVVRIFAPDLADHYPDIDQAAREIVARLAEYRPSNELPGTFEWRSETERISGGRFGATAYQEIRFSVVATHQGVAI